MLDTNPKLTKARRLREMLSSESLEFLMEAHSGISSKIAEEAGFSGIWASGLSIKYSAIFLTLSGSDLEKALVRDEKPRRAKDESPERAWRSK